MIHVPYPKLLDGNLQYSRTIRPESLAVDLTLTPLSSASLTLPIGEEIPTRAYMELFTSIGSVGIFRARSPEIAFGEGSSTTELEHAITEVGDWIIRGKLEGNYTIRAAMRAIFNEYHGSLWQLGSVSALDNSSDNKIDISYDHANILESMLEVLELDEDCVMQFDFSTRPWTVSFRKIDDTDGITDGRLSKDIQSATVTYDDTDLCTYAYYQYSGGSWATYSAAQRYRDLYGRIEKVVDTESDDSQAVARNKARLFIKRNHEPRVSVEITAADLHAVTGDDRDRVYLGRKYRLFIPEKSLTIERYITGLSWEDALNAPTSIIITLGDDDPSLWGYMRKYTK